MAHTVPSFGTLNWYQPVRIHLDYQLAEPYIKSTRYNLLYNRHYIENLEIFATLNQTFYYMFMPYIGLKIDCIRFYVYGYDITEIRICEPLSVRSSRAEKQN